MTDTERLEWCIERLFRDYGTRAYLTTEPGCGCCSESVGAPTGTSARDMIDAQIALERGE